MDRIGANKQIYEPLSVQLNIGGKECRTTVDTGASVSMVQLDMLRKITGSDRPVVRPMRIRVSALTGDAIGILGEVTLMVELDQSRPINFLVVEKAPHPALIGMDVLRALKVSIKIGKGSIKVGGQRYPASAEGVRTAKAGLHDTAEGKYSQIAVGNVTGRPIRIPKGKVLGRAEPVRPGTRMCAVQPVDKGSKKEEGRKPDNKDPAQVGEEEIRKYVAGMKDLKDDARGELLKLLLKYRWVFRTDLTGAGAAKLEPMKINTVDEEPVQARGPRLLPNEQEAERTELEKMARAEVVEPMRST